MFCLVVTECMGLLQTRQRVVQLLYTTHFSDRQHITHKIMQFILKLHTGETKVGGNQFHTHVLKLSWIVHMKILNEFTSTSINYFQMTEILILK